MTFEEFKANVQQWSQERGIYEHSTHLAQALKAVSEVGELADAVIKGDREALIDAIGDVAVCLANVAVMDGFELYVEHTMLGGSETMQEIAASAARNTSEVASAVAYAPPRSASHVAAGAMRDLSDLAVLIGVNLEHCCATAWNQIKERKGRMVAGGAFVKESEA